MSADPNKKSARTFQSRDVLWDTFNQMAHELECSVDYLINEAMKQYARQRSNAGLRTPYPLPGRGTEPPSSDQRPASQTATPVAVVPLPPPPRAPASAPLPPPPMGRSPAPPGRAVSLPAPPPRGASLPAPPPPARGAPAATAAQLARSVVPRSAPPPLPRPPTPEPPPPVAVANGFPSPAAHGAPHAAPPHAAPHVNTLTIVYQGERQAITKDRFVIGRGKQSSDLTLKDPNVSRQHAMVEFQNGVYFMVDMGSTNGVEYNGQRIARRQIVEGDVYRICDHAVLFTYR
jgi:hypothetical protein